MTVRYTTKFCVVCSQLFTPKSGIAKTCSPLCSAELKRTRMAKWHEEHRESDAAYTAKYHEEHRESRAAYSAKYHEEHRASRAAYNAKYYEENTERFAAYGAKYQKENVVYLAEYRARYRMENIESIAAYEVRYRKEHVERIAANHDKGNTQLMMAVKLMRALGGSNCTKGVPQKVYHKAARQFLKLHPQPNGELP